MKNRIISKILTCILATAIVISGSFFTNKNYVYGDTTIPSTFFVNGSMYQSSVTSLYGNTYQIPEWLYNQRFNIAQNGYTWSEVYDMWFDIVNEDLLTTSRLRNLEDLYKISNSYLPTDVSDTVGGALGSMVGGTATGNTSKVLKKWLGFIGVLTINTIVVNTILDLGKKVFNSLINTEKNYDVNAKEWKDLGSNGDYSLYQNYYDGLNGTNYNTGTTTNSAIYNNSNNKITDIVNNNQHYVTNYTYDLNNNIYDYTTDDGYQFLIQNSTKYVRLQSLINGVSNTYYQYFKLPNGDNSYNLTEDEIHGLKTDFNVSTYTNTYDYENLKTLYHFNGDLINSAYNTNNQTYRLYLNSSANFTYVNDIWDTALFMTGEQNIYNTDFNKYNFVSFRFMPSIINSGKIYIRYYNVSGNRVIQEFGKTITTEKEYTSKTNANVFDTYTNGPNNYQIIEVTNSAQSQLANMCNRIGGELQGSYYSKNGEYAQACLVELNNGNANTSTSWTQTQYFMDTITNVEYIGAWDENISKAIDYEQWNTFQAFKTPIGTFIRINNNTLQITDIDNTKRFEIWVDNDNYTLIDELVEFQDDTYINRTSGTKFLPYDTNEIYILPNNVNFNNNTILLKTKIINNWQVGGKRNSNPNLNDVYISVNENGIIDSIQQYVQYNWISIDGAIYSEYLGKFVGLIGYSIYSGDNQYKDIEVQDVEDISTLGSWLSESLNSIKTTITDGFTALNEKIDKLLHNDTSVEQDVFNKVNEIEDIQNQLDEEEILDTETQLQNYATGITQLATATNGIFTTLNDNNLQILYIAPICILLLRLII